MAVGMGVAKYFVEGQIGQPAEGLNTVIDVSGVQEMSGTSQLAAGTDLVVGANVTIQDLIAILTDKFTEDHDVYGCE